MNIAKSCKSIGITEDIKQLRVWALSFLVSFLLCVKGRWDMTRTLKEQLIKKGLAKKPLKKRKQKRQEKIKSKPDLSKREIEELMGIRRPTYRRRKGAFRQG